MSTRWDPSQYLRFADERTRPAHDLLARVPHASPATVYDLGCGPGNSTRLLRERWPDAKLAGVDNSAEMLETARRDLPELGWIEADLATWRPERSADVLFSNATFQWLGDHDALFPSLMSSLAPGGVLAIQMPNMFGAPSHTLLAQLVRGERWREKLQPLIRTSSGAPVASSRPGAGPVASAEHYYDVLAPTSSSLDIWETEYLHVLHGKDPVLEWTRGTALRPFLGALTEADRVAFESDYAALVGDAYPPRADGATLLTYRRLFIVATRPS